MRLIKLDEITGEEILARAILTDGYKELLSEGTKLKKDYVPKLIDMGITEVYIQDDKVSAEDINILKEEVTQKCREQVKSVMSRHIYDHDDDSMLEISNTADSIICSIMEEDEVVEQIYDIKERSADIYEHSINTCSLSMLVSLKMKLPNDVVHDIGVGCLLHDIGLRYITVDYEDKNLDNMTEKELTEYKKHPVYGYSAVKTENWLSKTSKEIILCHHEKVDGSGYPLHAKEMTTGVKIASVCDFFDESICGIGHVRLKVHEVVEYLKAFKGIKFDTDVVDVLLDFTAVYPSKSTVVTNHDELAVVIRQNKGFPERPVIQILANKDGENYIEPKVVDLLEHNNVFIKKVID